MKSNNQKSVLIIVGVIILTVFCSVIAINLLPESITNQSYYAKIDEGVNAKIETLEMIEHKVELVTSGEIDSYCIKTTKSDPDANAVCWVKIDSEKTIISILAGKKYYLWIKDTDGNISSPKTIEK